MVSTLVLGLSLGIWVNLLTDKLKDGDDFFSAVGELGWRNVWFAVIVAAAFVPVFEARRTRKAYIEQSAPTLQTVLELTLTCLSAVHPEGKPNGRYFAFDPRRKKLIREHNVEVLHDAMSEDFRLDEIPLDAGLVTCTSFTEERPIYHEPTDKDRERYSPEIRKKIPKDIRWVLACPVVSKRSDTGDAKPIGVVCIWGRSPPARSKAHADHLEKIAGALSKVFTEAIHGYQAIR